MKRSCFSHFIHFIHLYSILHSKYVDFQVLKFTLKEITQKLGRVLDFVLFFENITPPGKKFCGCATVATNIASVPLIVYF